MSDSFDPFEKPKGTRYAWERTRSGAGHSGELHDVAAAGASVAREAGAAANGRGVQQEQSGALEAPEVQVMGGTSNTPLSNVEKGSASSPAGDGAFLDTLKVDTCVLSARGRWYRSARAFDLTGVREEAKQQQRNQLWEIEIDGAAYEFEVYPHSTQFHEVLMRSPELAVTVEKQHSKMVNMPDISVRFGAQWFIRHTLAETRDFFRQLCRRLGMYGAEHYVTDVHLCVDHLHALTWEDLKHVRGNGTGGNCSKKIHTQGANITGISNYGKGLRYCIYNKSREVRVKNQTHWRVAMARHGLNPDTTEVWRVEVRARRSWLRSNSRHFEIDKLGNLNWVNLRKLWGYYTNSYMSFTEETVEEKRASKATKREWWKKLNHLAGKDFRTYTPPARPAKRQGESIDANFRQAVGCAAASIAESGAEVTGEWLEKFLRKFRGEVGQLTREHFEEKLREELEALAGEVADVLESGGEDWYTELLTQQLMHALEGKARASTHTHDPHDYGDCI